MNKKRVVHLISLIFFCLLITTACGKNSEKKERLIIIHAGSLSIPFKHLSDEFMKRNPDTEVITEAYGSRTAARQVSDLGRSVDILASADSDVIRRLLYPDYANFCIDFTSNEMVVAGTEKSGYIDRISSSNWYEIFLKDDIEFGYSDPDSDPCGYRSILTMKLSEKYYRAPSLFKKFTNRVRKKNIRPKEVDLLALLEAGELDYIFIYRSVARQHNLKIISLPEEINLGSASFYGIYNRVYTDISGKKPGEKIRKTGSPMIYGLTIPLNSQHKDLAVKFIKFLFGKAGSEIMKRSGQSLLDPPLVDRPKNIPEGLRYLITEQ